MATLSPSNLIPHGMQGLHGIETQSLTYVRAGICAQGFGSEFEYPANHEYHADSSGGIVVNVLPSREELITTLALAFDGSDPYGSAERLAIQSVEAESIATSPTAHLRGPRRTPWGTIVWSDPDETLPFEVFGPPPARGHS